MKLSSLEIKGFKSFGEKVVIHFDKGVTSIVGPNGSGKSNVVDAFRWVLGEQKMRMLRSEKMENIIFNGTKNRKPGNAAEVTLSFINDKGILPTEFSNVSITRKLYRSGESEYLLNGVTCRLKDITNLFLDTGIGADTYSIIELKMVDEIINDRNNTVKMLLEEAAGISKYKIRKTQTLNKLEETDADLNRVNDLLFEIEKSLKQLEQQAKKTEKYYKLKEDYKICSTELAVILIKSFSRQLIELRDKEEKNTKEKAEIVQQLETFENNLSALKTESEEKEKAYSAAQKQLNEKLIVINRFETENKSRLEKLNFLNEKRNQLTLQQQNDETRITETSQNILKLEEDKIIEEEILREQETSLQQIKLRVEESRKEYEASVEELKNININLLQVRQSVSSRETFVAVRQARINSLSDQLKRLNEQIAKDEAQLDEINKLLISENENHQRAEIETALLKEEKSKTESEIISLEDKIKELREQLAEERRIADIKNNEFQLTKSLVEQMDGFPESIKFLKKNYDAYKSTPLLSDILYCKEEYKIAIENYLEPFLNHFVVHQYSEAWEALQLLSDNAKGRAHFFITSSLENFNASAPENISGCIRALDIIESDTVYQRLFNYLLNDVYVLTEDVPLAYLNTGSSNNAIILSRSGKFHKQKYSISGGSVGLFDGKRSGKLKHLEKLESEISGHLSEIEKLKTYVSSAETELNNKKQQSNELNQKLYTSENTLSKAVLALNTQQSKKDFISSNNETNKRSVERITDEFNQTEQQLNQSPKEGDFSLDEMKVNLEKLIVRQRHQQDISNNLQKNSTDVSTQFNQQNISFLQQQNKIQNLVRDISYKNNQIEQLKSSIANASEEINSLTRQIENENRDSETSGSDLQHHIEERIQFENTLNENEKLYFESKAKIDGGEKEIAGMRRKKEIADEIIHALHNEINEVNLRFNSLKERLNIEFEVNIDELFEREPNPELNEDDLRQKTETMQNRLRNFGPINPMAFESFKEIKERYDFIIKEKEDLTNAKNALLQTISEIDTTAKEKFLETFNLVRTNFIRVFRSLFTDDDNCDLSLTDASNPLESDILIVAQPKGKKPLSIHQLSGGERTLTATALLFGLYLVKPAPFCIFDEVDAPLDDNNIDKFNKIIRKFSGESQFIVITHNKKTMAATDLIYGITMNEPGITAVVPVDLREYAEG